MVQFSPEGKRIATASEDETDRVWDAQTGLPITEPLKHDKGVVSAQFSPDSQWIATLARDSQMRVWDARSGQPLTDNLKQNENAFSARFTPDGRRIVSASADNTVRIWDVAPTVTNFPEWLLPLAEAVSGEKLDDQSVLQAT